MLESFFAKFENHRELLRWAEDVERFGDGVIHLDVEDLIDEGNSYEDALKALLELADGLIDEANAQWG